MTSESQNSQPKLKVIVLSPPIDKSGGIGTLFRYARENFPDNADVEFIDTRGYSKNPWSSLSRLLRAVALVAWRRMTGNVDVIHLNLGRKGAAIRKLLLTAWCTYVLHVPCVLQLHSSSFDSFADGLNPVFRKLLVHIMNRAARILVLGDVWRNYLISIGCNPDIVRVFVMGVPDLYQSRTSVERRNDQDDPFYYALFAGEMSERKGLPYLIEALNLPGAEKVRLIAAGAGNLTEWKAFTKSVGVEERVALLGLVDPALIHQLMGLADAMILPSRAEGLPVSVLEALSSGALAICTTAGSLSEFITDERDSVILASPSPADIASGLERAMNLKASTDLAANARDLWICHFDASKTTLGLVKIWRSVTV